MKLFFKNGAKKPIKTPVKGVCSDEDILKEIFKCQIIKTRYEDSFLYKPVIKNRKQFSVIIDEVTYRNILNVLRMTDGISMANFINNVLNTHFEVYGQEIEQRLQKMMEVSTKIQRS